MAETATTSRGYLLPDTDKVSQRQAVKDYNITMGKIDFDVTNIIEDIAQLFLGVDGAVDHSNNEANPHNVTKAQVGLGNVENTSDAEKAISAAVQSALDAFQSALDALPVITVATSVPDNSIGKNGDVVLIVDP